MKNGDITQLPELVKILEEEEEKMAVRETKTGLETGVAGLTISPQVKKSILCSSLFTKQHLWTRKQLGKKGSCFKIIYIAKINPNRVPSIIGCM